MRFYERAFQAKRGRYPTYVILFEAIKEQSEFDDEQLRDKLSNHSFAKHLTRTKNYLYNKILDFVPGDTEDRESELSGRIARIKFLFEKQLFHHLPEQIEPTVKLCEEMEDFLSRLRVLNFERETIFQKREWRTQESALLNIAEKETEIQNCLLEKVQLTQLRDKIVPIPGKPKSSAELLQYRKKIESFKNVQTLTPKILVAQAKYFIARNTSDFKGCIVELDCIISIMSKNTLLLQDFSKFRTFVDAAYFRAMFQIYYNNFDAARQSFALLNSIGNAEKREPILYLARKIQFDLEISRKTFDFVKVEETILLFESLLKMKVLLISPTNEIEIYHSISNILLIHNAPKRALKYISAIQGVKPVETREDIKIVAKILFLVAHYDLGNIDIVEQGIRSAKITIKRKKINSPFFVGVLKLFSRLVKAPSSSEKRSAQNQFLLGFDGPNELEYQSKNNYFDIKTWVQSKIEKVPYLELIRKFYQRKN